MRARNVQEGQQIDRRQTRGNEVWKEDQHRRSSKTKGESLLVTES